LKKNISILIPVYNFNVNKLVEELYSQALKLEYNFEILLIDDKSEEAFVSINTDLSNKEFVNILFLEENIGRSKIRNLLFEKAKYENCLVLDCDLEIIEKDFLKKYLHYLNNNVVVGGHIYTETQPIEDTKYFHWYYGSKVEAQALGKRLTNPYHSFMTSSFATTKSVFDKVKFDESITKYGHEDTIFGIELKKQNIEIIHIENKVLHCGLEDYDVFINKQEKAIENLAFLYSQSKYSKVLKELKLIKFHNSIFNYLPINFLYNIAIKVLNKQQSLLLFKIWKIMFFNNYLKKSS